MSRKVQRIVARKATSASSIRVAKALGREIQGGTLESLVERRRRLYMDVAYYTAELQRARGKLRAIERLLDERTKDNGTQSRNDEGNRSTHH